MMGLIVIIGLSLGCVKRTTIPSETSNQPQTVVIDKKEFYTLATAGKDSAPVITSVRTSKIDPVISPGDVISVTVFDKLPTNQDKRTEMKRVEEDGTVYVVPVGAVKVAGLSEGQVQKAIERRLAEFIVTPYCEVQLYKKQQQPHLYVFGEVGKSGQIPLAQNGTLLDAISAAGGCTDNAYRRDITVVRQHGDKVYLIQINLYDILKNGEIQKNIVMQDQDIVYVPWRFMKGYKEVISLLADLLPWYFFVTNFL